MRLETAKYGESRVPAAASVRVAVKPHRHAIIASGAASSPAGRVLIYLLAPLADIAATL
jgi:hypothetical protein